MPAFAFILLILIGLTIVVMITIGGVAVCCKLKNSSRMKEKFENLKIEGQKKDSHNPSIQTIKI